MEENKAYCKNTGAYPVGNLTLSNMAMACIESNHEQSIPRWIGVVKERILTLPNTRPR